MLRYYLIARELHEDGTPHLHACVEFSRTMREGTDWLDFKGKHPNKQDPRKWKACIQYCKKGGDFLESEEEEEGMTNNSDILHICQEMEDEMEWLQHCIQKRVPYQYATHLWNHYHKSMHTLTEPNNGTIRSRALTHLAWRDDRHVWIIKGPSGCGKTTWASHAAPKPALFVSHIDTLKKFVPGLHKSIIFDDVDFNHYPRTSQIHIVDYDNPRDIHCRHTVASIPAGIPKIFTCNEWPLNISDDAIKRRTRRFTVKIQDWESIEEDTTKQVTEARPPTPYNFLLNFDE